METFTTLKSFVYNPEFDHQRNHNLKLLDFDVIDEPILNLMKDFSKLDFCFTLQSCYGHFVHEFEKDPHNTKSLPTSGISSEIEYRIAYLTLCIDNNTRGKILFEGLKKIPLMNEDTIQFGCANWFWQRQVNSYVLQVEPARLKYHDKIHIEFEEALRIEKVRNIFFKDIKNLLYDLA